MNSFRKLLCSSTVVLPLALSACDSEDPSDFESEDFVAGAAEEARAGDFVYEPAMLIYEGENDDEDCLIWELAPPDVNEGRASGGGPKIMTVIDDEIYDADGNLVCVFEGGGLVDVSDEPPPPPQLAFGIGGHQPPEGVLFYSFLNKIIAPNGKILYSFWFDDILVGPLWKWNILGTSDKNIMFMSSRRKLLIAALFEEKCGSNGIPPYVMDGM